LPVDCDDEYWDHPDPEKRFKQPSNKTSSVTAFILYLKLQRILTFSLRTVVGDFLSNSGQLMLIRFWIFTIVFSQQAKDFAWFRRAAMATTNRRRNGFGVE